MKVKKMQIIRYRESLLKFNVKTDFIGASIWKIRKKVTEANFILNREWIIIEILKHAAFLDTVSELLDIGVCHEAEGFL
jgi:hypothetical protein